jgi:hypothetical protein
MIALSLAAVDTIARAEVRAKIDDILRRPEFGVNGEPSWIERLIARVLEALGTLFGVGVGGAHVLLWLLVALIAVALVIIAWRAIRTARFERDRSAARGVPATAAEKRRERVADLRARADAARLARQHLLALRLYFTALVVGLGEAGDLDYRDAWTNRELLERGRPKPAVASALAPLLADLDRKSFGGAAATERDVDAMAQLVDKLLRAPVKR